MEVPEALKYGDDFHFLEAYVLSDAPSCHDKCPHCTFKVRNDRKPISYGTKDLFYVDGYYDSDDYNYYNDNDSAWNRDNVWGW